MFYRILVAMIPSMSALRPVPVARTETSQPSIPMVGFTPNIIAICERVIEARLVRLPPPSCAGARKRHEQDQKGLFLILT